MTEATYTLLTAETVPEYVASRPELADIVDAETLKVQEVGDGNLNLVFVCRDAAGRGICLKQSLPYVRLVGESWPLTPHRATAEARGLAVGAEHAAEYMPAYYGFNTERFILAMENLDDWMVWRTALNNGEIHEGVADDMGRYVARLAFHTSLFGVEHKALKARLAESVNPELCEITEDLVFTEPYIDHERNSYSAGIARVVAEVRANERHVAEVGILKHRFMTAGEALIHGDLHTGSVMVKLDGQGRGRGKAFDAEFCFYGPVGFDLGALFGNYLAASARAAALQRPERFRSWLAGLPGETWAAFSDEMRRLWPDRVDPFLSDAFLNDWLRQVFQDSAGFGGCKAIRRIVGLAKVSDIETLEGAQYTAAATAVLRAGSRWVTERHDLSSPEEMAEIAAEVIAKEIAP